MRSQIAAVILILASSPVFADRFASTDYECDQANQRSDAGFKCSLLRQDGPTNLLVWMTPLQNPSAERMRRRQYEVQQIMDAFIARGGRFVELRSRSKSGELIVNQCQPYANHDGGAGCFGWQAAAGESQTPSAWVSLMK